MVSLLGNLPVLQMGTHDVGGYEREWIAAEIRLASAASGITDCSFADEVAASVIGYLENHFVDRTVRLEDVAVCAVRCLRAIGQGVVADALELGAPPVSIRLGEIAARIGYGFELGFYRQLAARIDLLVQPGVRFVRVSGVGDAVATLRGGVRAKIPRRRKLVVVASQDVEAELIDFVRGAVVQACPASELRISIS